MKLNQFLHHFQERRQTLLANLPEGTPLAGQLHTMAPSLALAQAALDKEALPEHPPQVVVLGPTQAGKSTLVNLILGQTAAGVSPLAGFTVHPQGFLHGGDETMLSWADRYFSGYRRLPVAELPRDRYDFFALETVTGAASSLPPCMIWDTPDFDSLRAREYLEGVLRTAALADVVVMVVSKDKYADQAVWDFLGLLEPLGQPTLICLNKVSPAHRLTLLKSWEDKWKSLRGDPPAPVIALAYQQNPEDLRPAGLEIAAKLQTLFKPARKRTRHLSEYSRALIRSHWKSWTAPVRAEWEAEHTWQGLVEDALKQAMDIYRNDFLDHPFGYETLQRALAELLILLEIPGLAKPMMAFRKVLTWPLRTLFRQRPSQDSADLGELVILDRSVEHALLQLQQALSEQLQQRQHPLAHWWQALMSQYRSELPQRQEAFHNDAKAYYQAFQPQIEEAADRLYRRLQDMPVTLNGLRAARASADAAGLALLLQTGGIGPHDFVLAPAVLSLTSWLSESALGKYMDHVAADLKKRQLNAVRTLLHNQLEVRLRELPGKIESRRRFAIPPSRVEEVEKQLEERRYGLQLF